MPWSLYGFDTCPSKHWRWVSPNVDADVSMTTLLSNTFAHFTGPSFMLKIKNNPSKKCFKSCGHLHKSRQKLDVNLGNKVF